MIETVRRPDSARAYLTDISRFTRLSPAEERDLARGGRLCDEAGRDALVHANLSFVVRIAMDYRHLGLPFEDLLNEGNLGLLEAARRFDAGRGARFITYAVWWIRKAMLRAVGANSTLVHVSSYHVRQRRFGGDGSWRPHTLSIHEPAGHDSGIPLGDRLPDERQEPPEQGLIRRDNLRILNRALASLSPQEAKVLTARFGLDGRPPETLRQVGATMGLCRERVRQIEKRALRQVRDAFAGGGGTRGRAPGRVGRSAPRPVEPAQAQR